MRLVDAAHDHVRTFLEEGDRVIDATAGNGRDTLFLARSVGPSGFVFAFDIQACALEKTKTMLLEKAAFEPVNLILDGHENMLKHVPQSWHKKVKAILFNLGYLPKGDKAITTCAQNTLKALEVSLKLLHPTGVLSIVAYPGHEEGKREAIVIEQWVKSLSNTFDVLTLKNEHTAKAAPVAFFIKAKCLR